MTQDELQEMEALCEWWKCKLRLSDWEIKLLIVRQWDIQGNAGTCNFTVSNRTAVVKLLDPMDYDSSSLWPQDMEQTLVHELLHIHMGTFSETATGSAEERFEEHAVDGLSKAFVEIKRMGQ